MASTPLRFTASRIPSPAITRLRGSAPWTTVGVPTAAGRRASSASSWEWVVTLRLCSKAGRDVGNVEESGDEPIGGEGTSGDQTETSFSLKVLLQRLRRYGVVGVLSYGLLNTVYYLTTFLLVWFYFAPAPGRMGYAAAVERFLKVMAMVWAGSQVTKIVRAGGALALAPFVARGLSWFTVKFKFETEGKAFAAIAGLCFGVAFILFLGLTFLWA